MQPFAFSASVPSASIEAIDSLFTEKSRAALTFITRRFFVNKRIPRKGSSKSPHGSNPLHGFLFLLWCSSLSAPYIQVFERRLQLSNNHSVGELVRLPLFATAMSRYILRRVRGQHTTTSLERGTSPNIIFSPLPCLLH